MDGKLIYTAMLFNDGKNAFDSQSMSWMTADRDAVVEDRLFRKCISDIQTQFVIFDVYTTADHSVFFIRDIMTCMHCVFQAVGQNGTQIRIGKMQHSRNLCVDSETDASLFCFFHKGRKDKVSCFVSADLTGVMASISSCT